MPVRIYPTVAEAIETHRLLIEEFGGLPGIRDIGLLESAIFRPQNGYYNDLVEEASALLESLGNNHAFIDGNKQVSITLTDVMLRANGYFLDADPLEAYDFITNAMNNQEFRFPQIRAWISSIAKPIED